MNFAKTQGILFARVVNSLILPIQDIAIFATTYSHSSKLLSHIVANSEIGTGKMMSSWSGKKRGKHMEFENRN